MSGVCVHPGQTLLWTAWILAAVTEGETPSGRGGPSRHGVGRFPYLGGFCTSAKQTYFSEVSWLIESHIVTLGHLTDVLEVLKAP